MREHTRDIGEVEPFEDSLHQTLPGLRHVVGELAQSLGDVGIGDHPGEFGLRSALRPAEDHPAVGTTTLLRMALRVDLVGAPDQPTELVVQHDRFALDVAGTVAEVRLDPVAHGGAERGPKFGIGRLAAWH